MSRSDLTEKMKEQLRHWEKEMEQLRTKVQTATEASRMEMDARLEILEDKVSDTQDKLKQIEDLAEDQWESIRDSFTVNWSTMFKKD